MNEHNAVAPATPSDSELLARIRRGDTASLEALYDRYAAYVHGLALRLLARREEADEITQDVFWTVWKNKLEYDAERARFTTWLFAVTRNRCLDRLRSDKRRPQTDVLDPASSPAGENNPETDAYLVERRRIILTALSQLPSEQRQAVELCFFSGMTHREVATHLGEPLGTVKSRIRVGMMKLKDSLPSGERA